MFCRVTTEHLYDGDILLGGVCGFVRAAGNSTCESCVHCRDKKTLKASCSLASPVSNETNCWMALRFKQNSVGFFFFFLRIEQLEIRKSSS